MPSYGWRRGYAPFPHPRVAEYMGHLDIERRAPVGILFFEREKDTLTLPSMDSKKRGCVPFMHCKKDDGKRRKRSPWPSVHRGEDIHPFPPPWIGRVQAPLIHGKKGGGAPFCMALIERTRGTIPWTARRGDVYHSCRSSRMMESEGSAVLGLL